jgi:hypothetical protein
MKCYIMCIIPTKDTEIAVATPKSWIGLCLGVFGDIPYNHNAILE